MKKKKSTAPWDKPRKATAKKKPVVPAAPPVAAKKRNQPKVKPNKPHVFKQKPNGKNDTGRPEVVVDLKKVKLFSRFDPTDQELAAALDISPKKFSELKNADPAILQAMEEGRALGRFSLRGKQFNMAMKGNVPLLIWRGKQDLGQREKILHGNDAENPLPENIGNLNREQLIAEITERARRLGIATIASANAPAGSTGQGVATPAGTADPRA